MPGNSWKENHRGVASRSAGARTAETGEELAGNGDVAGNLGAEFFGGGEFFFVAEAFPELDLDAVGRDFGDGFEDVRFDAERGAIEGRAEADVSDRATRAGSAFEERASDVDAASGEKFLVRSKIKSRKSEAAASARAWDDVAGQHEGTTEKAGGMGNAAGSDFRANQRTGDDLAFVNDWRDHDDVEAELGTEPAEEGGVARLFVAKAKVFADENSADAEGADENLLGEVLRGEAREIVGERQDNGGLEAERSEAAEALGLRGKARRRGFGAKDFLGRRVEGQDGSDGVNIAGSGDGSAKDVLVAEVDAVEVADGEGAAEGRGKVCGPFLRGRKGAEGRSSDRGWGGIAGGGEISVVELDFQLETVVGEVYVGKAEVAKAVGGLGMGEVMRYVGKPGTARIEAANEGEGLIHGLVHRMRHIAEGVENKVVKAGEGREGRVGDGTKVSDVSSAAETKAENLHVAMDEGNRRDTEAEEVERSGGFAEGDAGDGAEFGFVVEDVGEGALDGAKGFGVGEDGKGDLLTKIVGTNVIETHDVVGVAVSEEHGVETVECDAESLLAKIRSGVNDGKFAAAGEQQGRAEAFVAGIRRAAHAAMTAERGNAHGGAGAKNGDF